MPEDAFSALAEPHRREVLRLLREGGELAAGQVAAHFALTRPAVSQHLRVLEKAGLVAVRRQGARRLYSPRREGLQALRAQLEAFWDERLWHLKREAEVEERGATS